MNINHIAKITLKKSLEMRTYNTKILLKRFISMVEVQDRDAAKDLVHARIAPPRI